MKQAEVLLHYLQRSRDVVVGALDGLDEYDVRRPLTPSGTNLLGLVKHLTAGEVNYLGDCVGRPSGLPNAWGEDSSEDEDLRATAEESREELLEIYRRAWEHSDATVRELGLDAPGTVPWWREERQQTTLGWLLVHVLQETAQHAGHADILREGLDGRGGRDHDEVGDDAWWSAYVGRIQEQADAFRQQ